MQINYEKKCTSRILSGKMDEAAGIESPTNKQKGTTPKVLAKREDTSAGACGSGRPELTRKRGTLRKPESAARGERPAKD